MPATVKSTPWSTSLHTTRTIRTSGPVPATRNRAATDMFEPGSTVKPFAVMAALESGAFRPDTVVDTSPGYMRVGRNVVRDRRDLGELDVAGVLRLSSNVGVSHIALGTPPERLWDAYVDAGFGSVSESRAVGESPGTLKRSRRFGDFERATLSYGYGIAVTTLQLARAYTIFANEGRRLDLRLERSGLIGETFRATPRPVVSTATAREMLAMLEAVVEAKDGTGPAGRAFQVIGSLARPAHRARRLPAVTRSGAILRCSRVWRRSATRDSSWWWLSTTRGASSTTADWSRPRCFRL